MKETTTVEDGVPETWRRGEKDRLRRNIKLQRVAKNHPHSTVPSLDPPSRLSDDSPTQRRNGRRDTSVSVPECVGTTILYLDGSDVGVSTPLTPISLFTPNPVR